MIVRALLILYVHHGQSFNPRFSPKCARYDERLPTSIVLHLSTTRLHSSSKKIPQDKGKSGGQKRKNSSTNVFGKDELVARISSSFKLILQTDFLLAKYYTHPRDRKNNDDDTSIIDDPKERFKYGMIDFDFKSNLYNMVETLQIPGDPKLKPVYAMVRGVGGGKTRTLEELKMKYNEDIPNCLAIAITYNLHWTLENYELEVYANELFPKVEEENNIMRIGVGLSMITRIMSILYKTEILEIIKNLQKYFPIQDTSYLDFELVLVALLTGIIEDVRERSGYSVDNLIIMVDETKRVHEMMPKCKTKVDEDCLSILRNAVLNRDIQKYAKVNTAMILSSLTTKTFFKTYSDRIYESIQLPKSLNPDLIVEKWWLPQLNLDDDGLLPSEKKILTLLAATCAQSPRAAEVMGQLIAKLFNKGSKMDLSFSEDLKNSVKKNISRKYLTIKFPINEHMHALLFNYEVNIDDAIMHSIIMGSLSNPLDTHDESLIPDASVIMLAMAALENRFDTVVRYRQVIVDLYESAVGQCAKDQDGKVLEKVVCSVFELKLLCDQIHIGKHITISELLSIPLDLTRSIPQHIRSCLRQTLPKLSPPVITKVPLPSYYDSPDEFYGTLANPENVPSNDLPIMLFFPEVSVRQGNSHDMMIAVYRGDDKPPLLIILEFKSSGVLSSSHDAVKVFDLSSMPNFGQLYINTKTQLMTNHIPEGVKVDGLLKQIRSTEDPLPWLYVYMSTDERYTQFYAVDNCVVLASKDVYKFLGPFQHIYMAARGIYQLHKENSIIIESES